MGKTIKFKFCTKGIIIKDVGESKEESEYWILGLIVFCHILIQGFLSWMWVALLHFQSLISKNALNISIICSFLSKLL